MHEPILNTINNNGEWSMMSLTKNLNNTNEAIFFRLNTAVYFHDQKMIKIFFSCKEIYFKKLENKVYKFRFEAQITRSGEDRKREFYNSSINDYKFDRFFLYFDVVSAQLSSYLNIDNVNDIKEFNLIMSLIAVARNSEYFIKSQTNLINVKVKENTLVNSQQISLCLEPSFNDEKKEKNLKKERHVHSENQTF